MKKLLVLMLVLAMVSSASAVLDSITGPDVLSLGALELVTDTANLTVGGYFAIMPTTGTVTGMSVAPAIALGADASAVYGDSATSGMFAAGGQWGIIETFSSMSIPGGGTLLVDSFTGTEVISVDLYHIADDFSGVTFVENILVPEPITIALLGLGGLFLRRRK